MPLNYLEYDPSVEKEFHMRISSRDRLRRTHTLVLSGREKPLYHLRKEYVCTPIRLQEVWREYLIFFLGINSRRTNISPSVILRVAGNRRAANGI